jgi:hypothetical protein
MVTPHQAMMEAVRWLERLERGEISRINRRDLDVKLTPVDIDLNLFTPGPFKL